MWPRRSSYHRAGLRYVSMPVPLQWVPTSSPVLTKRKQEQPAPKPIPPMADWTLGRGEASYTQQHHITVLNKPFLWSLMFEILCLVLCNQILSSNNRPEKHLASGKMRQLLSRGATEMAVCNDSTISKLFVHTKDYWRPFYSNTLYHISFLLLVS